MSDEQSIRAAARDTLGFDPAALAERYRVEREKRQQREATEDYGEVTGALADDPYAGEPIARDPVVEDLDVAIIGGGFGGMLAAGRLRQAGVENLKVIEKAGDFGGTWYWNRYPGAACDIEAYIYMPLLDELGYVPSEKYARAPEILEHSQRIARHYGLYERALLQTEVTGMEWDAARSRWIVTTNRGDRLAARFVVTASGPLHKPKLPAIPGVESFAGHSFHTSRWDYAYTGGSQAGGLTGLAGKRVGIIGTGATAVQCIPHLAAGADQLFVFQRTPSSIDFRGDRPTDRTWAEALEPGWQQRRMDNFNIIVSGGHQDVDMVSDGWTDILRNLSAMSNADTTPAEAAELMQLADFRKMEQIRSRVDAIVENPEVAELLKPYYNQMCKRPCFHDDYLPAFNRPNVTLIDTQGAGVERITPTGVVANGTEYAVDCLVFATGFEFGTDYTRRLGFDIVGREGQSLAHKWSDGASTLHGMHSHGFPNLFVMSIVQAANSPNFTHMLNEQAKHIAYIVGHCRSQNVTTVEADQAHEDEWVDTIVKLGERQRAFVESCTPGYYNNEGRSTQKAARNAMYGAGPVAFIELLENWRATQSLPGLIQA
ncbi:MAG: NAD(P)/FAD-dependent oxidoreductase [Sphingomonadales bacterium]|nr:NAD(P)/FAD-dependent oxidoreductase [Sphingomonadales bacterium]